jgi:hypothetical protein
VTQGCPAPGHSAAHANPVVRRPVAHRRQITAFAAAERAGLDSATQSGAGLLVAGDGGPLPDACTASEVDNPGGAASVEPGDAQLDPPSRYISYLIREGPVRLELRYGATGGPEHRYRVAS